MRSAAYWALEHGWSLEKPHGWGPSIPSWENKVTGETVGVFELMEMYANEMVLWEYAQAKAIKLGVASHLAECNCGVCLKCIKKYLDVALRETR